MKPVKFVVLLSSLAVLVLTFATSFVSAGELKLTLWDTHNFHIIHPYVIAVAALIPAAFGALALGIGRLPRWASIVAVVSYGIALFMAWAVFKKLGTTFGEAGGIGAKLMVTALLGGLAASIAGIVKPERALAA